ncbi:B3 domain-containing transcription factor VRN1-like isoform X2 [Durio zibethinus]|uniref:B3 domain-containing transcription factor VRN1-like isoform X2 n=1 Tax=Durio zibethinus TaxID=66656 RepID=A0A6P5ZFP6_DURZI|nr:B3 domain-containing transcription factor VRN1-like isoform X2 [Durio zibethinus]
MQSQGMAAMSQNCRISEKHKYWKEFQSNRHQFFKIMVGDFRNHLRIPRKFMSNFRENLSGTIHLRGPSGFMWTVELERMFGDVVFRNGWEIFVKEHSLAEADLLVFRYDGNSTFNVVIFDPSGCEREGSYFVKKHMNACSSGRCVFQKEDGEDFEEVIDLDKIHENHMQKEKINKRRGRPSSKAVDTFYKRVQLKATTKKQPQVRKSARDGIIVLMDESDEASGCAMEASENWGKIQRQVDLQGTYNLFFISNRRELTAEEKQRSCKLARQYSSTKPSFSIIMKPSHVYRSFTVSIPKRWEAMHILDGVRIAELRVPPGEKRWLVRITSSKWRTAFTRGWVKFVKDNNLEEHDACVFEFNEESKANRKIIFFNVIIFRALDEIVTLTQFSRTQPSPSGYREITA